jgi:hypothetical protein
MVTPKNIRPKMVPTKIKRSNKKPTTARFRNLPAMLAM